MIPVASSITQTDTLPGEEIEFSIGDPRWVMRTQADLYSNRELAVAREYSTNAFDANKERALLEGTEIAPIEVTLPSLMQKSFIVRDHGYGMSLDTMKDVYTKFGSSTKRDSNDFNGMLGYGSKSAIAYTEAFSVVSIHQGQKVEATVSRRPDWSIVMKIVDVSPSSEPSGVRIEVPVHNWQEFSQKANDFYKFWKEGTVLVNGQFPKQAVGEKLTENLYYSAETGWGANSYIVMGNVPYRINNPSALFRDSRMKDINFVAYVDNGGVEFTPSREDLKYTEHTKATLHKTIRGFEDQIIAEANAEIAKATTHAEAFACWDKWTRMLGTSMFNDLEFKGDKFKDDFKINAMRYQANQYRNSAYRISQWNVRSMNNTLIVTEFSPDLSSNHKAKAREYMRHTGFDATYVLFTPLTEKDVVSPWIPRGKHFVTWEDLKAALPKKARKIRTGPTGPGRIPGTFDYWTKDGMHREKEIPANKTVYYIRVKDEKAARTGEVVVNVRGALEMMKDDGVVIRLAANRIDKFTRDNPQALDFLDVYRKKVVIKASSLLSAEAKEVKAYDYDVRQWVRALDLHEVDDPEFARIAGLIEREKELFQPYQDNLALAQALNMGYNVEQYSMRNNNRSLLTKYPLLTHFRAGYGHSLPLKELYIYLNAAYAASKKGN